MNATNTMAEYLVGLDYQKLPAKVISKCKELIVDSLACGVRGSQTPLGNAVFDFAKELGGDPHSLVLGTDVKTACTTATYVNASSINAMDYDDTGKGGHPGSSIIPATFALGEKLGCDGRTILLACVAGYEIGTRVAAAIEPTWERYRQIHGVGTAQTFGSMAACAKLLDLSLEETLNAFGIAGASAPVAHAGKFGWHDKSIAFVKDNVALPAEAGLRAALLAQRGYEGSESILDGDRGYWIMAGSDRCDFNRLTELSEFEIMGVSLKPYPCCRWIHTTLDVLNGLINEYHPDLSDIVKIEVFSIEPVAEFFGKKTPRTFVDMEFSVPCCVALKLHGIAHSQWFEKRHWNDSKILELASKVELILDEKYQDLYLKLNRQSARIPTRMEITLKGGKRLEGYSDDAWGSPTKPMNREERLHKIRDLIGEHIPFDKQGEFIHWTDHLEDVDNIRTVTGLLRCS